MKKNILLLMVLVLCISGVQSVWASEKATRIRVQVNGELINTEKLPIQSQNRVLVPVGTVFEKMGAEVNWDTGSGKVVVSKGDTRIQLQIGDIAARVNDKEVKMEVEPILSSDTPMIPIRFIAEQLSTPVLWNNRTKTVALGYEKESQSIARGEKENPFVVVIDPGHGGKDPGANYGGVKEKNLNLDIALKLNALLKKAGVKTYMTRTDDTYVGLYERSGLANSLNADLLISVHNNAGSSSNNGSMSLYYPKGGNSKGDLTAKEFAAIVQQQLVSQLDTKNLKVIPRPYLAVLRTSKVPSVLAEVGYMTNKEELKRLKTDEFRQNAAEALKDAVLKALKEI